ncbi:MAG: hypothetical protein ABIH77_00785 [Pseudomonadota bacterium]
MKTKFFLIAILSLFSVQGFANPISWKGKSFDFYVTNNTNQAFQIGPMWGGEGMPDLLFPQGTVVAAHNTIHYVIQAKNYVTQSEMGVLETSLFLNDSSLTTVCDSHAYVDVNTDGTLQLNDYIQDGLYVASKLSGFRCYADPVDFQSGDLHLYVNSKS